MQKEFIVFFFFSREGPSVQAEEAHHVPALEHHLRRPRPPRPHHARDGEGPDGRAQVRGDGAAGLAGHALQEGERQAGDLGQCSALALSLTLSEGQRGSRWRVKTRGSKDQTCEVLIHLLAIRINLG